MFELKEWTELGSDASAAVGGLLVIVPVLEITFGQHKLRRKIRAMEKDPTWDPEGRRVAIDAAEDTIVSLSTFRSHDWYFMSIGGLLLVVALILRIAYQLLDKFCT
jgi:hypothetical protein